MNNAEWIKLLRKQRERDEAMRAEAEYAMWAEAKEVDNESIIDNGDGNNKGSDASNDTGGEGDHGTKSPNVDNDSGVSEAGESDNGDA